MSILDHLLSLLVPATILLHLFVAPYTKVEESFNLQATHDIIRYGIPKVTSPHVAETLKLEYDHFTFPGAVPRTFVGSLVLAGFSKPFITALGNSLNEQLIVRGVLGLFNAFAILSFRRAAAKGYGRGTANWYLLLQCSQFHAMYYASRTLPNVFAFGLSTIGFQQFLPIPLSERGRRSASYRLGIYILTVTAIIFRSELALYLAFQVSYLLYKRRLSLTQEVIPAGFGGTIVGLITTLAIDSFFWQSYSPDVKPPIFSTPLLTTKFGLIWPELSAFHYNAVLNKASEWGASPWHTYIWSLLKLLLNPFAIVILLPMAMVLPSLRKGAFDILIPACGFVSAYSVLPHKEWRFIMYVIPGLTLVEAMSANWIWTRRNKSTTYSFLSVILLSSLLASSVVSTGMLLISSLNYPGGEALNKLHNIISRDDILVLSGGSIPSNLSNTTIHLDVPICMTGATRFLQEKPLFPKVGSTTTNWVIDKTENVSTLLDPSFWSKIDYTLSSRGPEHQIGNWKILSIVKGYKGVKIYQPYEETDKTQFKVGGVEIGKLWDELEKKIRYRYMQGWWIGAEMEPIVWILKKVGGNTQNTKEVV